MLLNSEDEPKHQGRRRFLAACGATVGALIAAPVLAHVRNESVRKIQLLNEHTGESVSTVYWEQGRYISDSLLEIDQVLRDHRTGDIHTMDTTLLDTLHKLHQKLGGRGEFRVISGYRSPKTNAMLRRTSTGVAKHSLHMEGRAIDIHLFDRPLAKIRLAAQSLRAGGVGYYPKSGFIHLDTGAVRNWS